jgi:hypothetical protein
VPYLDSTLDFLRGLEKSVLKLNCDTVVHERSTRILMTIHQDDLHRARFEWHRTDGDQIPASVCRLL